MKHGHWLKRGAIHSALLFFFLGSILLAAVLAVAPAKADGGIVIGGTFSTYPFEMPRGSSVYGPDINAVVINQSSAELSIRMVTKVPSGVNISLSAQDFTVQPGGRQQVLIGVEVGSDVVPGTYEIGLTAEPYESASGGLLPLSLNTTLTVVGESAAVVVDTLGPSGEPVVAVIRLFRVIDSSNYEVAYRNTGHLEATASPGRFRAEARSNDDRLLAAEEFNVADRDVKQLTLTVNTIYFEDFAIKPTYHVPTGELRQVDVDYKVTNAYQEMNNAEVRLVVTFDGAVLAEIPSILTMDSLIIGRTGSPYTYIPADGWQKGTYGFNLRLYIDGQLYAGTAEQTLEVGVARASNSWMWIIVGIIGGGLGLLILGALVWRRRKRGVRPVKFKKWRQPVMAGKETGVAGVFASRGILDKDGSFKMKHVAARPVGNGKGTVLARSTGVEKEKAGLSAAGILKKIKVWERIGGFRKKGGGNGHDGGERPAEGQEPVGKQASVARTTDVAKPASPAAAGGLPRQSNIIKEAAMRKPSSPATGDVTKEGVAKQAISGPKETTGFSKAVEARRHQKAPEVSGAATEGMAGQTGGGVKVGGVPKATGVGKQSPPPAASTPAKETSREPATHAIREAAGTKATDTGKGKAYGTVSGAGKESSGEKPAGVDKESASVKPSDVGRESAGGEASGDSRKSDDGAQVSKDKDKKGVSPIRFLNR